MYLGIADACLQLPVSIEEFEDLLSFGELEPVENFIPPVFIATIVVASLEVDIQRQLDRRLADHHALDEEPDLIISHTSLFLSRFEAGTEFVEGDLIQVRLDLCEPNLIDGLNDVTPQSSPHCCESPSAG